MTIHAGPYEFTALDYNSQSDLLDLSIDGRWGVGDEETPEGHWWFVAGDGSDEIVALQLLKPRERLEALGAVVVTLPTGEQVTVEGIENALTLPA
ncbi:MAG: hypothetical protein QOJ38_675 [Solirubrobacterales bacterium]|jgi:hypothetical protein|nr:hypothetical protein [Solirubrobacterales bacterium]